RGVQPPHRRLVDARRPKRSSSSTRLAVTRRRPPAGVVHHSDRGSQYTSLAFGTTLRESGLVASMSRRGAAYDNAACESVISTIKNELIRRRSWTSRVNPNVSTEMGQSSTCGDVVEGASKSRGRFVARLP